MRQPGKTDLQVEKIEDWFAQRTNDVLRTLTPVRDLDDLTLLAAICCHWNSPVDADDPPCPQCEIDGDPSKNFDQRALAHCYNFRDPLATSHFTKHRKEPVDSRP
jgi:hypothetical protein